MIFDWRLPIDDWKTCSIDHRTYNHCLLPSAYCLLNLLKGLGNQAVLVFPNRSQVNNELILLDAAEDGRFLATERFLQRGRAMLAVPDRHQSSGERLAGSGAAADYRFAVANDHRK